MNCSTDRLTSFNLIPNREVAMGLLEQAVVRFVSGVKKPRTKSVTFEDLRDWLCSTGDDRMIYQALQNACKDGRLECHSNSRGAKNFYRVKVL